MRLWPNLGGEEDRLSPALQPGHALRGIGRAWSLLFGRDAVLLSRVRDEGERRAWPEALGAEAEGACWPWLEGGAPAAAWWPDAAARAELEARGLWIDAPDDTTLRAVHDKAFTLAHAKRIGGLGGGLEELVTAFAPGELGDLGAVTDVLAGWPEPARSNWVLKPRFGSTGRGRVHASELRGGSGPASTLKRLAARGGAILEPWLDRESDFSVQLFVHPNGEVESLGSLRQLVKPGGAVLGGEGVLDEAGRSHGAGGRHEELVEAALSIGRAASARGFRGPCGIDSFAWRDAAGRSHLRRLCELNARFTTGHVAIGYALRAREAGACPAGRGFCFRLAGTHGDPVLEPL